MIFLKESKNQVAKEKKCDDRWDDAYKFLKTYYGVVLIDMPQHIHLQNSFHAPFSNSTIPKQSPINEEECHGVAGRVHERYDNGNIPDEWIFKENVRCPS